MNNKILKLVIPFFLLLISFNVCSAQLLDPNLSGSMEDNENAFRQASGFERGVGLENIVSTVIETFLGLLGIIFVVLMVLGGYTWMTAGGDESKIESAKKRITRAIIGLIIVVGAYSITYFVFNAFDTVT